MAALGRWLLPAGFLKLNSQIARKYSAPRRRKRWAAKLSTDSPTPILLFYIEPIPRIPLHGGHKPLETRARQRSWTRWRSHPCVKRSRLCVEAFPSMRAQPLKAFPSMRGGVPVYACANPLIHRVVHAFCGQLWGAFEGGGPGGGAPPESSICARAIVHSAPKNGRKAFREMRQDSHRLKVACTVFR